MNIPTQDGTGQPSRIPRRLPVLAVPGTALRRFRARVLDPADAALRPEDRARFPDGVHPAVYREDVLLVRDDGSNMWVDGLSKAAEGLGYAVIETRRSAFSGLLRTELRRRAKDGDDGKALADIVSRLDQVRVTIARTGDGPSAAPDAWEVLQAARAEPLRAAPGAVSLSHVLMATGRGYGDGVGNGYGDGVGNGYGDGVGYGYGDGVGTPMGGPAGRGPVVWSAPDPRAAGSVKGPGVVVLDTGLGRHPWFPEGDGVNRDVRVDGIPVGLRFSPSEDPEYSGVTVDTITGRLDQIAGHGTFIAGIIRQHCPEATILSVPVMMGDGAAAEDDVLESLAGVYAYHLAALAGEVEGPPVDVVSMSFGYYHETPGAFDDEAGLVAAIAALTDAGICVVAAAGNRSSDVPFYPAAISPPNGRMVSVGARNPGGTIVSAYSNTGTWVRAYRSGTNVVSTMPTTFNAAVRAALANSPVAYPSRGTPDPDDYSGGFGVWSGTSFAAPVIAGQIAKALAGGANKTVDRSAVIAELLKEQP